MSNNDRGGHRSGDRGDRPRHHPFNPPPPLITSQAYGNQYYQSSTSEQPVPPGHYSQVGYDQVIYPSQIIQPPRPRPDSYQYEQQSSPQYAKEYTASHQESAELKRTRESSSSSGEEYRPKHKHVRHRHGSEEHHHHGRAEQHHQIRGPDQGGQGSAVSQGNPQVPQTPVQNTDWGANAPSMGGSGAALPPQPQGGSRSYGDDETYEPRYNPFAGHQESASSLHASDARHRNDHQPHPESSAEEAGRFQEQDVPVALPSLETMYPESAVFGDALQPHAESSAQAAGRSQEEGVPVNLPEVASLVPGGAFRGQPRPRVGFEIDNIEWYGDTFDVDETRYNHWTDQQIHQLAVILASFESWEQVERLGQLLPGRRTWKATRQKIYNTPAIWRRWTQEEDRRLVAMGHPPENGVDEAGERFCFEQKRSRAEVGRRRMFARGAGSIMYKNLGNTPSLNKSRK